MITPILAPHRPSRWSICKALLRLIGRALRFALISDKREWVERQIAATRTLQSRALPHRDLRSIAEAPPISLDLPLAGWFGHSTCWVKWGGVSILTDPIWSQRCSPISFLGPSRLQSPPVALDNFPSPTLVLISHNHFDHLDLPTLLRLHRLNPDTRFFAPAGLGEWLTNRGVPSTSLALGQTECVTSGNCTATLTCTPAIHYSQRGLWDRNRTMWSSWVVNLNSRNETRTFFFAGDTAYNPEIFKRIGREHSIDLSFLPIGAYQPRLLLRSAHVDPGEAVKIHQETKSQFSIGCHHSTFMLSDPALERPVEDLLKALDVARVLASEFTALEVGQIVNW